MVDYGPWKGNYTGTVVYNNTIFGGFANEDLNNGSKGVNGGDAVIKYVLIEFMGLVTYKRSIGSRHPYKPVPAGPGLHCLGWPVSVAHDMSRSLPATSCTGGVRRRSRYLALTFFPCTRCAFL